MGICPSLPLQLQCCHAEIRGKVGIVETRDPLEPHAGGPLPAPNKNTSTYFHKQYVEEVLCSLAQSEGGGCIVRYEA